MQGKQCRALKEIQTLKWRKENSMQFKHSDRQGKAMLEKMETARII